MIRGVLALLLLAPSALAGPAITTMGVLGAYGSCKPFQSTWAPAWASLRQAYAFEESSGATTATDGSGNSRNASLTSVTLGGLAKVNKGVQLNGTSSFISTSSLHSNPQTFTIAMWFKTSTASGGGLFGFSDTTTNYGGDHDRFLSFSNDGKLNFGVYSGTEDVLTTPSAYNDGKWHHVTAVLATNTAMALYVDGKSVATRTTTGAQNFDGYWRFGSADDFGVTHSSSVLNGTIDEIGVWSVALNGTQIREIYDRQSCGKN